MDDRHTYIAKKAPRHFGNGSIKVTMNDSESFVLVPCRYNHNGYAIAMHSLQPGDDDDDCDMPIALSEEGMASDTKEAWTWAADNLEALAQVCRKEAAKPAAFKMDAP